MNWPWNAWTDLFARLSRIERNTMLIMRELKVEEKAYMATQAELDALAAAVTANTAESTAAAAALATFVAKVADLTAQLQAAVASGDSAAINAATTALVQNNAVLAGVVPPASAIFRGSRAGR
jgi:hypothetical protein